MAWGGVHDSDWVVKDTIVSEFGLGNENYLKTWMIPIMSNFFAFNAVLCVMCVKHLNIDFSVVP